MSRSKFSILLAVVFFVFSVVVVNLAFAEEMTKVHATTVVTKWHQIEVGDAEGHIIAVYESKGVWTAKGTDEQTVGISKAVMDFNVKKGEGTTKGYSERIHTNGDKMFSAYEGNLVGKGHFKGTWKWIGGTGKFEGLTGEGTWESKSMGPGVSIVEAEGTRFYKGQ
jgi:hypothetical protein